MNLKNIDRRSNPIRVDNEFIKELRKSIPKRLQNFPEENPRELTDRELTRMMRNTFGFEESLREIEKLPRKRL